MMEPVQITVLQVFLILLNSSSSDINVYLVNQSVLNIHVSVHGSVDGNSSIIARINMLG